MKFVYVGTEYTYVRLSKKRNAGKVLVEAGGIVETDLPLDEMYSFFKEYKEEEPIVQQPQEKEPQKTPENIKAEIDALQIAKNEYQKKYNRPVPSQFENNIGWIKAQLKSNKQ